MAAAILCSKDPFPLVHLADGSLWVGPWLDRVFLIAVIGSVVTILLASFARNIAVRVCMIAAALVLLIIAFGGWLGNSV